MGIKTTIILLCLPLLATAAPPRLYGPYLADHVSTYDGDTFTARVYIWPQLSVRANVRIRGIDSPELSRRGGVSACEKELAVMARSFAEAFLSRGSVVLTNVKPDKYGGRINANVSVNGENLADELIRAGHARPYGGGKRGQWCIGE